MLAPIVVLLSLSFVGANDPTTFPTETLAPSPSPSYTPTATLAPSSHPTETMEPSPAPTTPTIVPTETIEPSPAPTSVTNIPTETMEPSPVPTAIPTETMEPSPVPTNTPGSIPFPPSEPPVYILDLPTEAPVYILDLPSETPSLSMVVIPEPEEPDYINSEMPGISAGALSAVIIFGILFGFLCAYGLYRVRIELLIRRSHMSDDASTPTKAPPIEVFNQIDPNENIATHQDSDDEEDFRDVEII